MCALPLEEVEETMRPLPVAPVVAAPVFVRGVCLVRGTPAPVMSLAVLLGGAHDQPGPPPEPRLVARARGASGVRGG